VLAYLVTVHVEDNMAKKPTVTAVLFSEKQTVARMRGGGQSIGTPPCGQHLDIMVDGPLANPLVRVRQLLHKFLGPVEPLIEVQPHLDVLQAFKEHLATGTPLSPSTRRGRRGQLPTTSPMSMSLRRLKDTSLPPCFLPPLPSQTFS
jgi:hypothetical protein